MATPVTKKITQPGSNKPLNEVYVLGKGWYRWNPDFGVYNSTRNYDQLLDVDAHRIDFTLTAKDLSPRQSEQIDFIYSLTDQIRDKIIEDILKGRVPENWDAIELRWLLSERSDSRFGQDMKRRRKEYENTVIVNNL